MVEFKVLRFKVQSSRHTHYAIRSHVSRIAYCVRSRFALSRARSFAPRAHHASRLAIVSGGGGNIGGGSLGFSATGVGVGAEAGDSPAEFGGLASDVVGASAMDAAFAGAVAIGDDAVEVTATGAVANTVVGAGALRAGCVSRSRSRR